MTEQEKEAVTAAAAHDDHGDELKIYIKVFITLLVLTAVTVAVAYVPMSDGLGLVLAMAIAATKGTLVVMYFMHLKFEKKNIYVVAAVPVVLATILLIALGPDVAGIARSSSQPCRRQGARTQEDRAIR